ncbi:MFS transporter [Humitalea sp. 24SJ18S-53]|uniref:MFS transporter n=1 Tax=Humitalea sp. 24SJ18S-53 TaxID=3422307 RepID=UPI003D66DFC2
MTTPPTGGSPATRVVLALGTGQTLAWASSYYLPAILAEPMARDLGVSASVVFGAFSGALLLGAAAGPPVGRAIDRHGGRGVLAVSSLVLAAGLLLLAMAQGVVSLVLGWGVMGLGMAMGLYDPAFATLARLYGKDARSKITGITLIAGFASTIGWPATALMADAWGWRGACAGWAVAQIVICLPLYLSLPKAPAEPAPAPAAQDGSGATAAAPAPAVPSAWAMPLLAFVFAAVAFNAGAIGAHLPGLLLAAGATPTAAIAAAALIGPAQVGARMVEFGLMRRFHPLVAARIACLTHPAGALALGVLGAPGAAAFALLHGAGNGMLTIAKGTLPLAIFGAAGYGARTGLLSIPARLAQSTAPLLFGLLIAGFGTGALWLSAGLSLASCAALLVLRAR